MRNGGLVVLVMVLATGVFRLVAPSGPAALPAKTSEAAKPATKPSASPISEANSDLVDTIRQFYGAKAVAGTTMAQPEEAADGKELEEHLWVPKADRPTIRFVVAFVPDPIHTYLGLLFDRSIDAIQQGAQAEGCSFDRGEVPWDAQPPAEPTDPTALDKLKNEINEREKWPGLLIFRKHGKTGGEQETVTPCSLAHLFVLLVGETPTGGIRKDQFKRALTIIRQIRGTEGEPALNKPLYLLGPNFSGSLYSLNTALADDAAIFGQGPVTVFSGTISSLRAQTWFEENTPRLYFATFQQNDSYLIKAFAQRAQELRYKQEEIAVISEDETEYGHDVQDAESQPAVTGQSDATPAATTQLAKTQAAEDVPKEDSIVYLRFPREISQLRAAYQSITTTGNASSTGGRSLLPLDLQLTGSDDESVPDFAKLQTPLSQEAVLLAITNVLHKHRIKLVLLLATDPMDRLFLAQFLRRANPSARIGVTSPDLLLTREGDASLHGTFGVSAYALVANATDNFYTPAGIAVGREEIFPSTASQGLYNATIGLLEVISHPESCSCKHAGTAYGIPPGPYAGYGSAPVACAVPPPQPLAPTLQLTMLGRDGYWLVGPLPTLDAKKTYSSLRPQNSGAEAPKNGNSEGLPPPSLGLAIFVLILTGALHARLAHCGSLLATWEASAQFAPICPNWATRLLTRDWLLAVGALALGAAYILLLTARVGASYCQESWSGLSISVILGALLILFTIYTVGDLRVRRDNPAAATLVAVGITALAIGGVMVIFARPAAMSWLWSPHGVHLTSGCSAALALLLQLAGCYWWMWYGLRGMVLSDDHRPRLPQADNLPNSFVRLSDSSTKNMRRYANPLSVSKKELCVLGVVALVFVLMPDRAHPIQTLEGRYFEWSYFILLFVLVCLLVWSLAKLILIWGECRRLLMAIDRLPLREAFKRLDGFPWSSLWSSGSSTLRESYRYLARQFESLRRLQYGMSSGWQIGTRKCYEPPQDVVDEIAETLKENDELEETLKSAALQDNVEPEMMDDYIGVLQRAAKVAGLIAKEVLEPEWRTAQTPSAATPPKDFQDKAWSQKEQTMVMLAEEYVSLTYVSFLAMVMVRIRSLVVAAAGIYVCLLISISVYPFEPSAILLSIAVALFFGSGAVVAYVYMQMHRDATLSHLTSTTAGELDLHFWVQIVGAGALPLLTLLAGQVPAVNQIIVTFLEPALQAVK
jgi:hypothetical protein